MLLLSAAEPGMKAYLHLHYPRLLYRIHLSGNLIQALKNEVKEDVWT